VTHTANFSMTALEQLSSEQLVNQAVALHVTRFQCVQLYLPWTLKGFIQTINTTCMNLKTIFKNKLLIFQDKLHNAVRNIFRP
jgi:hypothetical protein